MTIEIPEPQQDTLEQFAADLRRLRIAAGTPTYELLSSQTGVSKSVLAAALSGKSVPSARTVAALVRAFGADMDVWLERRDGLAGGQRQADSTGEASEPSAAWWRRRSTVVASLGGFAVGAAIATLVTLLVVPLAVTSSLEGQARADIANQPRITVDNGDDPAFTECVDDAAVATAVTGPDDALLEIIWSNECYAGWGRITRYDEKMVGNTVSVAIYPETAPDGPDRQQATEHGVQGAYTTLLVRKTPDTLV
ncbi:helix-turn-helix domain-containing protein, partial [Pseudoclavibacter helvolus]|uniref:helix-turn-helix domain-containing protein n=1 Tax=Pseudoclavibacter helvolus TaxID=255205 RepID=UPI0024ACF1E2